MIMDFYHAVGSGAAPYGALQTATAGKEDGVLLQDKITTIHQEDVLLGRGKSNVKHPGNLRFQALINNNRERYFSVSTQKAKRDITEEIVRKICEKGRFLKMDKTRKVWLQINTETARIKVAQALQYRQRRTSGRKTPDSDKPKKKQAQARSNERISSSMITSIASPTQPRAIQLTAGPPMPALRRSQGGAALMKFRDHQPLFPEEPRVSDDEIKWALGFQDTVQPNAAPSSSMLLPVRDTSGSLECAGIPQNQSPQMVQMPQQLLQPQQEEKLSFTLQELDDFMANQHRTSAVGNGSMSQNTSISQQPQHHELVHSVQDFDVSGRTPSRNTTGSTSQVWDMTGYQQQFEPLPLCRVPQDMSGQTLNDVQPLPIPTALDLSCSDRDDMAPQDELTPLERLSQNEMQPLPMQTAPQCHQQQNQHLDLSCSDRDVMAPQDELTPLERLSVVANSQLYIPDQRQQQQDVRGSSQQQDALSLQMTDSQSICRAFDTSDWDSM